MRPPSLGKRIPVRWLVDAALLMFVVDLFLLAARPSIDFGVLLVVTAALTLYAGAVTLFDLDDAVDRLRVELRSRGRTGLILDWPDYVWRSIGFALVVMGLSRSSAVWRGFDAGAVPPTAAATCAQETTHIHP